MRFSSVFLGLLLTLPLSAQQQIPNAGTKRLADGTERLEAPVFGTGKYFRMHFASPLPKVKLKPPTRLADFLVDDHLELSLRGYLELVLENNTEIAIEKLTMLEHGVDSLLAAQNAEEMARLLQPLFMMAGGQFGGEGMSDMPTFSDLSGRGAMPHTRGASPKAE